MTEHFYHLSPLEESNRFPHLYVLPLFIDSQKFFDELLVVNGHNRSGTFHKMALRFVVLEGAHRQATKSHKHFLLSLHGVPESIWNTVGN